jgi:hypothetical protein
MLNFNAQLPVNAQLVQELKAGNLITIHVNNTNTGESCLIPKISKQDANELLLTMLESWYNTVNKEVDWDKLDSFKF